MKKFILSIVAVLAMLCCTVADSSAQNEFYVGSVGLNFGIGCGTVNHSENHWNNIFIPSIEFAGDYSFLGNVINRNGSISGGIYLGVGQGSKTEHNIKYSDFCWRVGTRGALHYSWVSDLDTYAGVAFGCKHQTYKIKNADETTDFDFDSYGFGGARYKFNHSVAAYAEVATTHIAWFQIGISVLINN